MPFQYRLHKMPLVTIPQGKIGYVFARDGQPLPPTQTLAEQRHGQRLSGRRRVPARRRPARTAAQDPARRHLRDQPRAVRRDHRASASTSCRSTPARRDVQADGGAHRRARRLRAGGDQGRRRRHRHRHRARRPVAARRADHRADGRRRCRRRRRTTTTTSRTRRGSCGRRPARPPAAGAGRGHLLHQPAVRDGRDDPQDGGRGRQRRRGRVLHRRGRRRPVRRRVQARRAGERGTRAACGASRCCPASTRSTPTPAR